MKVDPDLQLRVLTLLLGTESGGIRSFLLHQQSRARDFNLVFDYVAFSEGEMCDALRAGGNPVSVLEVPLPVTLAASPVTSVMRWMMPDAGFGIACSKVHEHLATPTPPDCLYSHFLHNHLVAGKVGKRLQIPCIGQVHGTLNPRRSLGLTRIGYSWALFRSLDTIVMVSNTAANSLTSFARAKARTVYNGIDTHAIEAAARGARKTPGKLIIVGRLVPGKKIHVAIRGLANVIRQGIDISLDVVGSPTDQTLHYDQSLRQLARELDVSDRVTFAGSVNPPFPRLAAAEICVNCSTVEGLSYVVMESMLCRTPIIVANEGAPSEMVRDGETGLHFKADDPDSLAAAIIRLHKDHSLRERLAEQALVYARQTFDITTHMRAIRAVFEETISRHRHLHPRSGILS